MQKTNEVGSTGTYIDDLINAHMICQIPTSVALTWVQDQCPQVNLGNGRLANELVLNHKCHKINPEQDGWLNKLYIIVQESNSGRKMAIYKHDGIFYLYRI